MGRLAELAVDQGVPVLVGLEVPMSEQPPIDAFLAGGRAGAPGPAEMAALTASGFWHRPPLRDDGRAGEAMVELLATLRTAAARDRVQVCALDQPWREEGSVVPPDQVPLITMPPDQLMADNLIRAVEQAGGPGGLCTLVLAGNFHTRVHRHPEVDEVPLGELLAPSLPVTAWLGHWTGGQIRARMSPEGVGVHPLSPCGTATGSVGRYGSIGEIQHHGHHGWINVGPLTPSMAVG